MNDKTNQPAQSTTRWVALAAAALCASLAGTAAQAADNADAARLAADTARLLATHATDQIILKFRAGAVADARSAALHDAAQRFGVQITGSRAGSLGQIVTLSKRLPNADAAKLAEAMLAAEPALERAQADAWATISALPAAAMPNDPLVGSQWHYADPVGGINLTQPLWKRSKQGKGVVVAVLDTGYRPHVDLAANIIPGYDMIVSTAVSNDGDGRDADAQDPGDGCGGQSTWHGTHVSGTIAAVTNNGIGVAGVAPKAKVQPVRVLGCGGGYFSDIEAGIEWASGGTVAGLPANPTPAKVISLSLGGFTACPATTQTAINNAIARGTTVVVAAGNYNMDAINFAPANCNGVITVAATTQLGAKAYYSNYGASVEIAAPGGDGAAGVLSTLNAGVSTPGADSYASYIGTSMATPHVSGTVALMLARNPALTPAQVLTQLQATARPFPGVCNQCGAGIVDATAAVP